MRIGPLEIRNTDKLLSPDMRICALLAAPAKFGKTSLAAQLNALTMKYRGKPTLIIATEAAEGGGTMSVAKLGIDYVMPANYSEMSALIASLKGDTKYGGVILDNGTEYVNRIVKPHALTFKSTETGLGARELGVPVRSDYQIMGEAARMQLNQLINLTNENTKDSYRKDLIVTALERDKTEQTDAGEVSITVPDFPGALANVATALFQSVLSIKIKDRVVPDPAKPGATKRIKARVLHVKADGRRVTDDRTGLFVHEYYLTDEAGRPNPNALIEMYEQWRATLVVAPPAQV